MSDQRSSSEFPIIRLGYFFAFICAASVLGMMFGWGSTSRLATVALVTLGAMLLVPILPRVEGIKIGPKGLEASIREVVKSEIAPVSDRVEAGVELTKKVAEANAKADEAARNAYSAIGTITRFIFNSMPQPTFVNLQKIASNKFGPFAMHDGFREQLKYLRDGGYIATNNTDISTIPDRGDELSDFVYCTELGKEFIAQRLAAENATRQRHIHNS